MLSLAHYSCSVALPLLQQVFHEMKGDEMANQQKMCNKKLPSAVVVNAYTCFYDPFWVKNDIGTEIHSLQLH